MTSVHRPPLESAALAGAAPSGSGTPDTSASLQRTLESSTPKIRLLFWLGGLTAASLQAVASRWYVSADALSYLDIARGVCGDWHALINGYWSPLFPLLLSLVFRVFPSLYWESTLAHLTNVAIFVFAFASFEFLVASIMRELRHRSQTAGRDQPLQEWALWALCDSIFVCYTLLFRTVSELTPDLCMAGLVFLAAALLVRIRTGNSSHLTYAASGIVLALSYLAKAVMFPLSLVFLGCCLFACNPTRKSVLRALLALVCFAAVATPFIWNLSRAKGRLTFGDTGKIAYAEYVDNATRLIDWQGGVGANGRAIHATRQLLANPPVFEFSAPVRGTYPPWYDPSYWYEGITPAFHLKNQLRAIRYTTAEYAGILPYMGPPLVGFLTLVFCSRLHSRVLQDVAFEWPVWLPALAGLGIYALVHVEPRLVVTFLVLAWVGLFAAVRAPDTLGQRELSSSVTLALVAVLSIGIGWTVANNLFRTVNAPSFTSWQVAEGLHRAGIESGEQIASMSNSFTAYWARLAGLKIVAEILPGATGEYWSASPRIRSEVLADFAEAGAKAVVLDHAPPSAVQDGWKEIGQTGFFVLRLASPVKGNNGLR